LVWDEAVVQGGGMRQYFRQMVQLGLVLGGLVLVRGTGWG
jgi:hypothetical protein